MPARPLVTLLRPLITKRGESGTIDHIFPPQTSNWRKDLMKMCDSIRGRAVGGLLIVLLAAMMGLSPLRAVGSGDQSGELFVLATLYTRHKSVAVYDPPALRKIILAIDPEVMVLDVTPSELKE